MNTNQDKVALVTGASSGIGKALSKRLLQDGYVVYATARRVERMKDLEELGAVVLSMDITKDEDIAAVVAAIQERYGAVDVLVNNAGYGSYGAMEDTSMADARYQFEVNLFGLATLTQALVPAMRERRSGRIINISSVGGKIYTPLGSWYHATKHALEGWSDCLRLELAPFDVKVVVVEPGLISTEFGSVVLEPMLRRSGNSAYADMAKSVANATESSYKDGSGTPPEVVAACIARAARARRPKTRYVVGKLARPMIFIRKWFGDRVFDAVVRSFAS